MKMLLFLTWLSVFQVCLSYNSSININTTASATITNFQVDLAACSCDISTACDTFCCCDSKCTSDLITKWTNNNWCADNAVQIQKLCKNVGSKGFSTFQDLGCVMYTNRGAIGMFYSAPNSNSFVDPNIPKFSTANIDAKGQNSYTLPTSVKYQQYSAIQLKINSVKEPLIIYLSSVDQSCRKSYIPLNQGTYTSSCSFPILNFQACEDINQIIGSTFLFCQFGNCSSTVPSSTTVPTVAKANYNNGSCGGVVTQVTVQIVMGYQNGEYKIVSGSLGFVTATITGSSAIITTKVSITKSGSFSSGNPGYIVGKSLSFSSGQIYQIANPTDKSCLTTSSVNNNNLLPIKFGVNQTFTCLTTTPCANSLYIDQISKATSYKIQKYASQSAQQVNTTASSTFSCTTQSYSLYIIYTYSGWVMDKQNYIIGSKIVAQSSANSVSDIKMKQLNVKWIQVEPNAVSTPPTNYFYTYFQYLWVPLSSAFYKTVK